MASALFAREPSANVVVVDWLAEAQNHYVLAARRTRAVGREVARFIDWLEVRGRNFTPPTSEKCFHEKWVFTLRRVSIKGIRQRSR